MREAVRLTSARGRRSAVRRTAAGATAGLAASLALPDTASAHGIQLTTDLPIPEWLFAWAAAVVLVVSFVALATLWPAPRLAALRERDWWCYPRALEPLCGLIGVGLFAVVVYSGIAGAQLPYSNLAPAFIYVAFWVGLAFVSVLVGDVFRPFNPWRAFARAAAWGADRVRHAPAPEPLPYPTWLGSWPAAVGILCFAWLELSSSLTIRQQPRALALLALVYAALQLIGMSLYGIEAWSDRADGFGVYFGLLAMMAPLRWSNGRIHRRKPFVGLLSLEMLPGTIALIAVMIGSTSFDGLSNGTVWLQLYPHLFSLLKSLGFSPSGSAIYVLPNTLGLLAMVFIVAGLYRLGAIGMRSIGAGYSTDFLASCFAYTLVPIAIGYLVAHYFSLLAFTGQLLVPLASDPLGNGANIFGTANFQENFTIVSGNLIWYVQVAALLVGHVAGLALAHDRALMLYPDARDATRSQYCMLTVMVAFTCLGLFILSSTQ